jgi:type I restriction enzyme S subunit
VSFPAYPSYRDSGLEWLGAVPNHWNVRRLKEIAEAFPSNVDKKAYENNEPIRLCNYTDVYYNDKITSGMSFMEATATQEQIDRFSLRSGDVIITKDSESADDIAIAAFVPDDLPGVVCGYHLSMIRARAANSGAFLKRYFDSPFAKANFAVRANGLTRVGLGQYAVDNVPVPCPPIDEQLVIAAFLDRETARIDALIEEQQRLNVLLKEKRQAVISDAVTKGLDPTAPMKDSGVEWLGEVPAHWSVSPLMRLTAQGRAIMYGIVLPGPDVGEGVPIVKGGDVKEHRLRLPLLNWTTPEIEAPFARARLLPGDIVYSIRGSIGDAEPVPEELRGANITQDVARISPSLEVDGRWLLHVMRSKPVFVQLEQGSLGAAVRGINIFDLKRARIPVPPKAEQAEIAAFLDRELSKLELLAIEARAGIALLTERRAALISAAVTGKIDVRGVP